MSTLAQVPQAAHRMAWIGDSKRRYQLYAAVALGLAVMALASRAWEAHVEQQRIDFVEADGRGYYVYLPSLVIDGDLDFRNNITERPELLAPIDTGTLYSPRGYLKNKYTIGMALTLMPSFLAAHGLSTLLADHGPTLTPDGYSLLYQVFNLAVILALSWATMVLADKLARQWLGLSAAATLLGILSYWLLSNYLWYCFREPFMVHLVSTFWVVLTIFLSWRISEALQAGRRPFIMAVGLAAAVSMALVSRSTNAVIAPFLAVVVWRIWRAGGWSMLARMAAVSLIGLFPLLLQVLTWREINGRWWMYSYGEEGFNWLRPALWQTLFSTRHGLFTWSPILLGAVLGMIWWRTQRRTWPWPMTCLLVSAVLLWYLNSAWHEWWFGWAFGARSFLELGLLFILGLGMLFELAIRSRPRIQVAVAVGVLLSAAVHVVLMGLYQLQSIPRGGSWRN